MPLSHLAVEVFCSYAQEDEQYLRQLEAHLSVLKRQGLISLWHDRQILPGANWVDAIDEHLETASIILLMISAYFIASDYCYGVEMKRALERHKAGEARVIPIVVRPCDWRQLPLGKLQASPMNAKPISQWRHLDLGWTQVTAELRRVIEDLSLLSASTHRSSLPPIWMIPYPRNPFFQGHDALLLQIHTQLWAEQVTALSQPQAISGLGGIGKTQIAIEYAYRYSQEYQMVLWARAESVESLNSSYAQLAVQLNLPEKDAEEQKIVIEAVKTWLHDHTKWLLILDNADDLDILPPFLATIPGGHVLLTTRAWDMQRLATRLEVKALSDEQGAVLLLQRAGLLAPGVGLSQASSNDSQWATRLTQELGGLPLALDQVGAYLEATGISLDQYCQIYLKHRQALLKQRRSRISDHPDSVATTWSLSFQQVEKNNFAAADLLRFCAYLAPDAIPEEIIIQGAKYLGRLLKRVAVDAFLLAQAVEALRAYSLVSRNPQTRTLSIHRLVQAVLRDSMPANKGRQWKQRAMHAVNAASPNVQDMKQWEICERWLPHAQVCADWMEAEPEAANLLNVAGNYLHIRARYGEAEELYKRALKIRERQLGTDHPDTATVLNNLAGLYASQGKYGEAEGLCKRALAIREQRLGATHPDTAQSLNTLANLYYQEERYVEAEPLYTRALSIREQRLGATHPDTAQSLNNLANLYYQEERYVEAEPLYTRALSIYEQLETTHPATALSLNNLAGLYASQRKYGEAEELYKRALAIKEQRFGAVHPSTATSLNNLAGLYYERRKYAEAEPLYKRALEIRKQQLGAAHLSTTQSFDNLIRLYQMQGKHAEAESMYALGLTTLKQQSRTIPPPTSASLDKLTGLYENQGKFWEPEPVYGELPPASQSKEQQLEAALRDLISLLRDIYSRGEGNNSRVEQLYERMLLSLMERRAVTDHLNSAVILSILMLLSIVSWNGNYWEERSARAEDLYKRMLWLCEHLLSRLEQPLEATHLDSEDLRGLVNTLRYIRYMLRDLSYSDVWPSSRIGVELYEYMLWLCEHLLSRLEQPLEATHLDSEDLRDLRDTLMYFRYMLKNLYFYRGEGYSSRVEMLYERMFSRIEETLLEADHLNPTVILGILVLLSGAFWNSNYREERHSGGAEELYERMLSFIEQLLELI